jgi:hypothetical protein
VSKLLLLSVFHLCKYNSLVNCDLTHRFSSWATLIVVCCSCLSQNDSHINNQIIKFAFLALVKLKNTRRKHIYKILRRIFILSSTYFQRASLLSLWRSYLNEVLFHRSKLNSIPYNIPVFNIAYINTIYVFLWYLARWNLRNHNRKKIFPILLPCWFNRLRANTISRLDKH